MFFSFTLRNMTSSIYDILTGFKRPKDVLEINTGHLEEWLRVNIGDLKFQETFDRTGRILNIAISPQSRSDPPCLLSYLTSSHVLIWSAALVSSSLPGVFEANQLMVKDSDGTERYETQSGMAIYLCKNFRRCFNINQYILRLLDNYCIWLKSRLVPLNKLEGNLLFPPFFLSKLNSISTRSPKTQTKAGRGSISLIKSIVRWEYSISASQ